MGKEDSQQDEDSVAIVVSALDDYADGKITWDEMNIRIHDKRYHKNGYKVGETCKYRVDKPGSEIRMHYENISKGIPFSELENTLRDKYGVEPIYATEAIELEKKYGFRPEEASWFRDNAKPTSRAAYEATVRAFFEVCEDIRSRYPKFQLDGPKLLSWEVDDVENYRAFASLDRRNIYDTNRIVISDCSTGDRANAARYHILRHEIGHNLATKDILKHFIKIKEDFGEEGFSHLLKEKISERASSDDEEAIAEIFSVCLSPHYVRGELPQEIEDIADMLIRSRKESIAMDENNKDIPRQGIAPLNPMYGIVFDSFKPEPEGVIRWHDNAIMKFVTFRTYEDRCRYFLKQYGVPQDWIDALCTEFPNKEWSISTCQMFCWLYRETSKTLEESIEDMRQYINGPKKEERKN